MNDLEAVQIVEAVEDVDAFGLVPWKPLSSTKIVLCRPFVRKGDDTQVDVDIVPQLVLEGFIVGGKIR